MHFTTCVDATSRGPDTQLGANSLGRRRLGVGSQPVGAEVGAQYDSCWLLDPAYVFLTVRGRENTAGARAPGLISRMVHSQACGLCRRPRKGSRTSFVRGVTLSVQVLRRGRLRGLHLGGKRSPLAPRSDSGKLPGASGDSREIRIGREGVAESRIQGFA